MDDGDIGSSEFTGLDPPQPVDSDSEDPEVASRAIQREKLIKSVFFINLRHLLHSHNHQIACYLSNFSFDFEFLDCFFI
jgi:hypothetical protein